MKTARTAALAACLALSNIAPALADSAAPPEASLSAEMITQDTAASNQEWVIPTVMLLIIIAILSNSGGGAHPY
ncbi:hypothetical protein C2I36_04380 [Rhodobacteraceae bacterium WD3A24]|nr:hypothetical protein C2I36_04380 [Rhodobacteraceae bacterium WD3A24]